MSCFVTVVPRRRRVRCYHTHPATRRNLTHVVPQFPDRRPVARRSARGVPAENTGAGCSARRSESGQGRSQHVVPGARLFRAPVGGTEHAEGHCDAVGRNRRAVARRRGQGRCARRRGPGSLSCQRRRERRGGQQDLCFRFRRRRRRQHGPVRRGVAEVLLHRHRRRCERQVAAATVRSLSAGDDRPCSSSSRT